MRDSVTVTSYMVKLSLMITDEAKPFLKKLLFGMQKNENTRNRIAHDRCTNGL